jgi:hypothetical protein
VTDPVCETVGDKVLELDSVTVREPRAEGLAVEDTLRVTEPFVVEELVVLAVVVRETDMLLETVGVPVPVFDPATDLVRVTEAVILRVGAGVRVTVLEFVVLVVAVPVPVTVRDGRVLTDNDDDAVAVFEGRTLTVAVQVVRTDLLLAGERVSEGLPVEVFESFRVAEPVEHVVLVFDALGDTVILVLPVLVFDELGEPVFVFEMAIVRLGAGLSVAVLVPLLVILSAGLVVDVFEGMPVQVAYWVKSGEYDDTGVEEE